MWPAPAARPASAPAAGVAAGPASATSTVEEQEESHAVFFGAFLAAFFGWAAGAAPPASSSTNVVAVQVTPIGAGGGPSGPAGNGEAADVDDSRELADAIEEQPEVVIRALELEADRPLGVQLAGGDRLRLEAADRQVRFAPPACGRGAADRRRPSLPAESAAGFRAAPAGRDTSLAELGQLTRRREPLVDARADLVELARRARRSAPAPACRGNSRYAPAAGDRQHDEHRELRLPRQLAE